MAGKVGEEREIQKSYCVEHSADLTVEAMILDPKASDLDREASATSDAGLTQATIAEKKANPIFSGSVVVDAPTEAVVIDKNTGHAPSETVTNTAIVVMTISAAAIFTVWQVVLQNQAGYPMKTILFKTCLLLMYAAFLTGMAVWMTTSKHRNFQRNMIFPKFAVVLMALPISLIVAHILKEV